MIARLMTNAEYYLDWIRKHGLSSEEFFQVMNDSPKEKPFLIATRDRPYIFDELEKEALFGEFPLFHLTEFRKSLFDTSGKKWKTLSGYTGGFPELLKQVNEFGDEKIVLVEDVLLSLRDQVGLKQMDRLIDKLDELFSTVRFSNNSLIILIEHPETLLSLGPEVANRYTHINVRVVDLPDEKGLFRRGKQICFLPYLRAYLNAGNSRPAWEEETWEEVLETVDGKERFAGGYTRFLRADHSLDWLIHKLGAESTKIEQSVAIHKALRNWLVPLDRPLYERLLIIDRRVEAVRLCLEAGRVWSRRADLFPNQMRRNKEGLDPVHTPENQRAGLTRYLCEGWWITNKGRLESGRGKKKNVLGPSTSVIPRGRQNTPRRLMLGASLQLRAEELKVKSDLPNDRIKSANWNPPGVNVLAGFSTFGGWTHEDAIVLSKTASEKLQSLYMKEMKVLIPAVASRVEIVVKEGEVVERGAKLVRAFVDLYALGYRGYEAEHMKALDGWLEVAFIGNSVPIDARVVRIRRESISDLFNEEEAATFYSKMQTLSGDESQFLKYHEAVTFVLEVNSKVSIGDKLSTRHGIKGVVSIIVDDADPELRIDGKSVDIVLSPIGIARRGAMGQFREASGPSAKLPQRTGVIFVMRQPQDAEPRCRVRGHGSVAEHINRYGKIERGQRYGEMEFWALMAHGVPEVAMELLSPSRSTANWMHWEAETRRLQGANTEDHRILTTSALNRYLSMLDARIEGGQLVKGSSVKGFHIRCRTIKEAKEAWDLLNNAERFAEKGGLGIIEYEYDVYTYRIVGEVIEKLREEQLPESLLARLEKTHGQEFSGGQSLFKRLTEDYAEKITSRQRQLICTHSKTERYERRTDRVYVLPPWLRPNSGGVVHKLTFAYQKLIMKVAFRKSGVRWCANQCVKLAMNEGIGLPAFLRREILGRRLTRSARAVIVPRPDLRVDQISIPRRAYDVLFDGLSEKSKKIVLVNRNPTLHRYGLIALRPVRDDSDSPVFGLPLGVLKGMGADFDGDQASVVALETPAAVKAAENMLPGCEELRADPFRKGTPAFQFLNELSIVEREKELALEEQISQEEWCLRHFDLLSAQIRKIQDGWKQNGQSSEPSGAFDLWTGLTQDQNRENFDLWKGLKDAEWQDRAERDMEKVYLSVRQKGRLGGVLRRQLYQRAYKDDHSFWESIAALQAVTERLAQSSLSVKSGGGVRKAFKAESYFREPQSEESQKSLKLLEPNAPTLDGEKISASLGESTLPLGLLAWLSKPNINNLLSLIRTSLKEPNPEPVKDPRISWFLG